MTVHFFAGRHLVSLYPMNNAEQTDVLDHSLVAPDGGQPSHLKTPAELQTCFSSDLFKKLFIISVRMPS